MKKNLFIAYLICLAPFFMQGQNINGFWKGTLDMNMSCFPVNNIELQITITRDSLFGKSYHYLDVNNYVKKDFNGSYFPEQKKVIIREEAVATYKIPVDCKVCIKTYDLMYIRTGNVEVLRGEWTGHFMGSPIVCEGGPIVLSRIKESAFKEVPEIKVDTGEIRLDFYDNGEIDGDSITVLVNKRTILSHQRLEAKPITTFVKIDSEHRTQEVEMVAENVGSIPPNTALLIITAGKKRYELFLTSTTAKSAMVRFIYEK